MINIFQQLERYELRVDSQIFSQMGIKRSTAHHKEEYQGAKTVDKLEWDEIDHKLGTIKNIPEQPTKKTYQTYAYPQEKKITKAEVRKSIPENKNIPQTISFGVKLKPPEVKRQIISNPQKEEIPFNWESDVPFVFAQETKNSKPSEPKKEMNHLSDTVTEPKKPQVKKENGISLDFLMTDSGNTANNLTQQKANVPSQDFLSGLDFGAPNETDHAYSNKNAQSAIQSDSLLDHIVLEPQRTSKAKPSDTLDLKSLYSIFLISKRACSASI